MSDRFTAGGLPARAALLPLLLMAWLGLGCDRGAEAPRPAPAAYNWDFAPKPSKTRAEIPSLAGDNAIRVEKLEKDINQLRRQARCGEAVPLAEELVSIRRQVQGGEWWETHDAVLLVKTVRRIATLDADVQRKLAEADEAEERVDQLFDGAQFGEGVRLFRHQLEVRERHLGPDHPYVAASHRNLMVFLRAQGAQTQAHAHCRKALTMTRKVLGDEHPDTASNLVNLAELSLQRNPARAMELLDGALPTLRRLQGREHEKVADALNILGAALHAQRQYDRAKVVSREGLAIRRRVFGDEHREVATCLNNLAGLHFAMGDYYEAERSFREALSINRRLLGDSHPRIAATLSNLAATLKAMGRYAEAMSMARMASDNTRELLGDKHLGTAHSMNILAQLLHSQGDFEEAERVYRKVLEIRRELLSAENQQVLNTMTNLAVVLYHKRDDDAAEAVLREVLAISQRRQGDFPPVIANAVMMLGVVLREQGHHDNAEEMLRHALTLQEKNLGPKHPDRAASLQELAYLLERKGDPENLADAERMYREAISIWREAGSPLLVGACAHYGHLLYRALDRPLDAVPVFKEAIDEIGRLRKQYAGDELDRSRFFQDTMSGLGPFRGMVRAQLALAAYPPRQPSAPAEYGPKTAFEYLEQGRGRALLDLMARGGQDLYSLVLERARREQDDTLRHALEAIREREYRVRATLVTVGDELEAARQERLRTGREDAGRITELEDRRKEAVDAERQVARDLYELARAQLDSTGLQPMTADQVAAALGPNELLLAYDIGAEDSLLLVVNPAGDVTSYTLAWRDGTSVGRAALTAAVSRLVGETGPASNGLSAENDGNPYGEVDLFYAVIPEALHRRVWEAARILVVADGPLHRLPFETLAGHPDNDARWVDAGPAIIYGPSATVLMNRRQRAAERERVPPNKREPALLVAVGDPVFSRSPTAMAQTSPASVDPVAAMTTGRSGARTRDAVSDLGPLPGTRIEVEAISRLARKVADHRTNAVRTLLGEKATVTNLFQETECPRFLHLATHGLTEGGRWASESALVLTTPTKPTPDDNGLLTLGDLLSRWSGKLNGTELVTLSACRSAQGKLESGEGFVALTWGFLYAGAESVVASLWKVDDTATALLMTRFYENLLGGFEESREVNRRAFAAGKPMPKAEALLEGKRWLRHLTARQIRTLTAELHSQAPTRGATYRPSQDGTARDHTFADPFYWGAFVLIGDGS